MTIGEEAAAQLWQGASAGTLRMEPDAAREVAQAYLRFAAQCDGWREEAEVLRTVHGFGPLSSAQQLQEGFANKAGEAKRVLGEMATAARAMADGYLQAAGILAEVDQLNATAMRTVAGQV